MLAEHGRVSWRCCVSCAAHGHAAHDRATQPHSACLCCTVHRLQHNLRFLRDEIKCGACHGEALVRADPARDGAVER